jgi:periplasmic protein TonB
VHPPRPIDRPIVDVVLGVPRPGPRRAVVIATCAGVGAFAVLGLWALDLERRPGAAHERSTRVPVEISLAETVDPRPLSPVVSERPTAPRQPVVRPTTRRSDARASGGPSAQAAAVVAQEPSGPVDLTGETLVVGAANAYAGGATQTQGTSTVAGEGNGKAAGPSPRSAAGDSAGMPDHSAPVGLASQSWSCPWPSEADPLPIDAETVVIRVVVRPDGSAESVAVVSDPGHGFGEAAARCAMRTRFTPARAAGGEPIRTSSPAIRVRFTR